MAGQNCQDTRFCDAGLFLWTLANTTLAKLCDIWDLEVLHIYHGLLSKTATAMFKNQKVVFMWAIPPVRLGLSGRNSGKIPERPRKRSQSVSWNFPREYGWDAPNPIIQGI